MSSVLPAQYRPLERLPLIGINTILRVGAARAFLYRHGRDTPYGYQDKRSGGARASPSPSWLGAVLAICASTAGGEMAGRVPRLSGTIYACGLSFLHSC